MDHQEYVKQAQQAAQLFEAGKYEQAQELRSALVNSELSDRDKAVMCLNLAMVCDKLGQTAETLHWYDYGIAYERRYGQSFLAEYKANYLAEHG